MRVAAFIGFADLARLCLLGIDLLQRIIDRGAEIGGALRTGAAADAAAARGALQRLVLIENRAAHLQQLARVNRAHRLSSVLLRGLSPHAQRRMQSACQKYLWRFLNEL